MPNQLPWAKARFEPTPTELLTDPICLALMRADGVRLGDVIELVRCVRRAQASDVGLAGMSAVRPSRGKVAGAGEWRWQTLVPMPRSV